jgi:hypothetical protein
MLFFFQYEELCEDGNAVGSSIDGFNAVGDKSRNHWERKVGKAAYGQYAALCDFPVFILLWQAR